jgi:hypothetical protein
MTTPSSPAPLLAGLALALVAGCGAPRAEGDTALCDVGRCDELPFLARLEGREDPVGRWLRQIAEAGVIDAAGIYHGDRASELAPAASPLFYAKLLDGLATVQGCRPESLITYALADDLVTGAPGSIFPRLVATVCSDDGALVTNAFVATLGEPHRDGSGDLELDDLEVFAWDATAQRYSFYAIQPGAAEGQLDVEVEPARCMKCHLSPLDTDPVGMPRLPIMNELTKPWAHWEAGAGGVSESFAPPASVAGKPYWEIYGATAAAASRLEKVIRDASALRVAPARAKQLFRPAKVDEAMALIRPLFCDEQIQYVTELATGEVPTDAVVAGGVKSAFRTIQATWPWRWFNDDTIQLPVAAEDARLFMMPVRGMAETTFEGQLQTVLTPSHVLAVRALDWRRPVFSDFRCQLWKDAWTAYQVTPPTLSGRNRDALKVVYEGIMALGGMSTAGLASGRFVAIPEASEATVTAAKAAIAGGTVPATCGDFCEVDATGFGDAIDAYVGSLPGERAALAAERDRRVCKVVEEVEGAGAHADHGPDARVANQPSFLRVLASGATIDTTPSCP